MWMGFNAAPSKAWLVVPLLLALGGVLSVVVMGNLLKYLGVRDRRNQLAVFATLVLTVWSFLAMTVTFVVTNQGFGATVAMWFFGLFIAVPLGIAGFVFLQLLLRLGAALPILRVTQKVGGASRESKWSESRTPVR